MCVLWTILWESKELWMLFPSHWASLWYDSGWLHHAGQANLTDRQAAVMAHFGIKAFMKTISFLSLLSLPSACRTSEASKNWDLCCCCNQSSFSCLLMVRVISSFFSFSFFLFLLWFKDIGFLILTSFDSCLWIYADLQLRSSIGLFKLLAS